MGLKLTAFISVKGEKFRNNKNEFTIVESKVIHFTVSRRVYIFWLCFTIVSLIYISNMSKFIDTHRGGWGRRGFNIRPQGNFQNFFNKTVIKPKIGDPPVILSGNHWPPGILAKVGATPSPGFLTVCILVVINHYYNLTAGRWQTHVIHGHRRGLQVQGAEPVDVYRRRQRHQIMQNRVV
jgi:hypothetical protein